MAKKILFIVTHSEYGGAQRFFHSLISRLNKNEYDMSVAFGAGDKDNTASIDYLGSELTKLGINTHKLEHLVRSPSVISDIKAVFEIRKLIKKEKPETLFLGSSKAGFVGALATVFPSRIKGLRVIYRIGGWTFNDPWPAWKRKFWVILERISASWKDVIIVNNKRDYDDAKRLKINSREGCVLIHNGVDVFNESFLRMEVARLALFEKMKNGKNESNERNGGNAGLMRAKFIIGTIANFYKTKGIEYLIVAMDKLKNDYPAEDLALVIIGDGPGRVELENLIHDCDLKDRVFLTGQIENASKYLRAFDIYVQPSLKEGFPWSVLDAMTAKLPVVATSVGAVPEMIDNGQNGLTVEPRKPGQLVSAILKLIRDDHMRSEFGIQANQKVHFNFDIETMIKKTKALL